MAAWGGDRRAGRDDVRDRPVRTRRVPQREAEVPAVAEVPHGRHSTSRGSAGRGDHRQEGFGVVACRQMAHRIRTGVECQMYVGVDQTRHQGRPGQVDDLCSRQIDVSLLDRTDPSVIEQHPGMRELGVGGAVEKPVGLQDGHGGARRRSGCHQRSVSPCPGCHIGAGTQSAHSIRAVHLLARFQVLLSAQCGPRWVRRAAAGGTPTPPTGCDW